MAGMYSTLRDFVDALDKAGELKRITTRVSPILEVSAIADRVSKSPAPHASEFAKQFDPLHAHLGGQALLFENVEGSKFPLLINAFGSYHRLEMALGCHAEGPRPGGFAAIAEEIAHLTSPQPPTGLWDKLKKIPELLQLASYPPRAVGSGPCQEIVKTGTDINLFDLPIIKCWPADGDPRKVGYDVEPPPGGGDGRYITFAGVYTIHPDDAGKSGGVPRPDRKSVV